MSRGVRAGGMMHVSCRFVRRGAWGGVMNLDEVNNGRKQEYFAGEGIHVAGMAVAQRGIGHYRSGLPCQDAAVIRRISEEICAGIVCDGHGSSRHPYSQDGSRLACEAAAEVLKELYDEYAEEKTEPLRRDGQGDVQDAVRGENGPDMSAPFACPARHESGNNASGTAQGRFADFQDEISFASKLLSGSFEQRLWKRWNDKVMERYMLRYAAMEYGGMEPDNEKSPGAASRKNAGSDKSRIPILFGTTFNAVVSTPGLWIAFQLGDGAVYFGSGHEETYAAFSENMAEDSGRYTRGQYLLDSQEKTSPVTDSLCNPDAPSRFVKGCFLKQAYPDVMISTDGIYDAFGKRDFADFALQRFRKMGEYPEKAACRERENYINRTYDREKPRYIHDPADGSQRHGPEEEPLRYDPKEGFSGHAPEEEPLRYDPEEVFSGHGPEENHVSCDPEDEDPFALAGHDLKRETLDDCSYVVLCGAPREDQGIPVDESALFQSLKRLGIKNIHLETLCPECAVYSAGNGKEWRIHVKKTAKILSSFPQSIAGILQPSYKINLPDDLYAYIYRTTCGAEPVMRIFSHGEGFLDDHKRFYPKGSLDKILASIEFKLWQLRGSGIIPDKSMLHTMLADDGGNVWFFADTLKKSPNIEQQAAGYNHQKINRSSVEAGSRGSAEGYQSGPEAGSLSGQWNYDQSVPEADHRSIQDTGYRGSHDDQPHKGRYDREQKIQNKYLKFSQNWLKNKFRMIGRIQVGDCAPGYFKDPGQEGAEIIFNEKRQRVLAVRRNKDGKLVIQNISGKDMEIIKQDQQERFPMTFIRGEGLRCEPGRIRPEKTARPDKKDQEQGDGREYTERPEAGPKSKTKKICRHGYAVPCKNTVLLMEADEQGYAKDHKQTLICVEVF